MRSAVMPLLSLLLLFPAIPALAQEGGRVLYGASWDAPEAPAPDPSGKREEPEGVPVPESDEGILLPIDSPSEFARVGELSLWYGRPDRPYINQGWMSTSYGQGPKRVRYHGMGAAQDPDAIRTSWMGASSSPAPIKEHRMGRSSRPARIKVLGMGGAGRTGVIRHSYMGRKYDERD